MASSIQAEIRQWLLSQSDWLQEAAERLLKQGRLTDEDLRAIASLLKTPAGQAVTKHRAFEGLLDEQYTDCELRLVSVGDVSGIENLSPRKALSFGGGNLTVIYGHNGSGKSSYTRILKNASGKPRAVGLKPNVFHPAPDESMCQLTYELGGQKDTVQWNANGAPIDAIRAVDIFDNDEAGHYLSKESPASYIPPVVALFESLGWACDQIRLLLQAEQSQLVSALPAIPANYRATESGRRYDALKPDMTDAVISHLVTWTEDDKRQHTALTERLKVDDPTAVAKKKRSTKVQVEQIIAALRQGMSAYGEEGILTIRNLRATAKSKRQIATEATHVESAKLDGVGSETWRAMWDAARSFSQIAYPDFDFPVTADARCVLCQQELVGDAPQRLRDFETFVQGKLEADANIAETAYQAALDTLPVVPTQEMVNTQCEAAGLPNDDWKQYLWSFWNNALQCRTILLFHELIEEARPVNDISDALAALQPYLQQLETDADQSDKDAQEFDRLKAENDKLTLEAKQWVTQQESAVRKEIERLRNYKAYEDWKALANPRKISLKAGDIAQQVITQEYIARFNRELELLGATRIKVELIKTRTDRGKVLHQLRLKGAQNGLDMPDAVLSEGERRIISLAAFLADVADKPQSAPFIFDDPISSLDQDFEWNVASRLVDLSKHRQVLVFTHRLSLYGAIEDVSRKVGEEWKRQNYQPLCIEAYAGIAGHPVDQATWNANTRKANNLLLERLGAAKRAGEEHGGQAYRHLAQGICSDFRKLLERTVEDDLLNQIVKRHRRSITTDNRLAALPLIELDDCRFIDSLMTKYSCYEHSQSQEIPAFIPEEPELREDIHALKNWRQNFLERIKLSVA